MAERLDMRSRILLGSLFMVWVGLVLGVSFLATPVKFTAPNLTLPVALEVGHVTFHLFNTVEWGIMAGIAVLALLARATPALWLVAGGLFVILLAESFWLLPALDVRLFAVVAGNPAEPNHLHHLYIAAEVVKLLLAAAGGWKALSIRTP